MNYTIKRNKHFCNWTIDRLQPFATKRAGEFIIPLDNHYSKALVHNSGWNKLTGIGQIFGIHTNSGRLVWQPNWNKPGYFTIAGYVYDNGGTWKAIEIANVKAGDWIDYKVEHTSGTWRFTVNGVTVLMSGKKPFLPLKRYPYFGGKDKAYYKMKFYFI